MIFRINNCYTYTVVANQFVYVFGICFYRYRTIRTLYTLSLFMELDAS